MKTIPGTIAPFCVVAVLILAGCGGEDRTEAAVERSLDRGFLDPLDDANLDYEVVSACHYHRDDNGPWSFAVHISIAADFDTSAAALATGADIITDRRPTAIVQQHAGQPNNGWRGGLTDEGDTTDLDLVKNSLDISDRPSVGWLQICEESLPS